MWMMSTRTCIRFRSLVLVALTVLCIPHVAAAWDMNDMLAKMKSSPLSPGAKIYLPSDQNYANETTQRYTTHDEPTYVGSIKPATEVDVVKIVKIASALNIPFLATGGGHGFATTFGNLHNGIEIDLGFFNTVKVNAATNTMTVGGAVIFRDVYEPLYNAGKEIQTGSCSCAGFIGVTLGGGVGKYQGLHGMIIDALLSVRMITGTGEIVTASATENTELFWGVRGAGFNYGIVVSATYQIYDTTSQYVVNGDFIFPANRSSAIFQFLKSYETGLPAKLMLTSTTGYIAALGGTVIIFNVIYTGPMAEAMPLIQPLIDAKPIVRNITSIPWKDVTASASFAGDTLACIKGANHNIYGVGIKTYDLATFETFFANLQSFYLAYPNAQGSVFIVEHFPTEAVRAIPDDATAYPYREITAHLLFNYRYSDTSLEPVVNAFAQNARLQFSASSGFDSLQVYVSYGHGDEGSTVLYADRKLPRLRKLKKRWDPKGLFNFNEPLS